MPESADMDDLLLSVVGLGFLIVGSVIWLSRRRPDSRVRQLIARADWQFEAQDFDAARDLLAEAEEPFTLVHDEEERRDLRSEIDRRLGAIALIDDDYDEAERRLTSAVENCDTLLSSRDPSSLGPLGNLAIVQFEQGRDLQADANFERILEYEPNEYLPERKLTADRLRGIAMACVVRNLYRWPDLLLLRSLEHLGEQCDPTGDRRVRTWLNLAQSRFVVANYSGTREALAQASQLADDESDYSSFSSLRGHLALLACEWEEAEHQLQRNHEIACAGLGERSNAAAEALGALAALQRVQGRFADAERVSRESLEIVEECFGEDHSHVAFPLMRHGMICLQHGDLSAAERHLDRGIELARQRNRRANSLLGTLHLIRGIRDLELDRLDAAAESLQEARRISESVYGRGHRLTMDSIMVLADVRLEQGRMDESDPLAEEALEICRRHEDTCPLDRIDLLNMLARLRMAQGDLPAAERVLEEVRLMVDRHVGPEHHARGEMLHEFGRLCRRQRRLEEAEHHLRDSLNIQEQIRLPDHPAIARVLQDLAHVLTQLGREPEAAEAHSRAESIRRTWA